MKAPILGLRVASAVFGLMAIAQVARLIIQPLVLVNGGEVPLWPSVIAVVLLGSLSFWMWKLACGLKE
jgi:hypothetical protein